MKHKLYIIISVLIIAVLAFGSVRVLAQGCLLSGSQSAQDQFLNSRADRNGDCDYPLPPSSPAVALAQPSVIPALGAPGFSLSYASTIGDPTVGYFEDTTHLNFPYGVGMDGSHVWIADSYGNRALYFNNDGSFVQQIGKAGFSSAVSGTELEWISDVAVDSLGQIWTGLRTTSPALILLAISSATWVSPGLLGQGLALSALLKASPSIPQAMPMSAMAITTASRFSTRWVTGSIPLV